MEWIDPQPTQCNTSWAAIAAVYGNTHSYCCRVGHDRVAEYKAARIPGAKFFDIDGVCLPGVDLPHMLPSKAAFAAAADALGINNDDTVVVYDGMGMFSAPRVWWTFKVFGHDRYVWNTAGGGYHICCGERQSERDADSKGCECMMIAKMQWPCEPSVE